MASRSSYGTAVAPYTQRVPANCSLCRPTRQDSLDQSKAMAQTYSTIPEDERLDRSCSIDVDVIDKKTGRRAIIALAALAFAAGAVVSTSSPFAPPIAKQLRIYSRRSGKHLPAREKNWSSPVANKHIPPPPLG